ncbi:hypothetical protein Shyhy01_69130 [Streptomyces hygroscopicus subsp. hygroscopicus]|nr:hypothetical protein Shyhy01_69130 [Streptomyces hygroscopicus subsp. hygroscopicus]
MVPGKPLFFGHVRSDHGESFHLGGPRRMGWVGPDSLRRGEAELPVPTRSVAWPMNRAWLPDDGATTATTGVDGGTAARAARAATSNDPCSSSRQREGLVSAVIRRRLAGLGLRLPEVGAPKGAYVPAVRSGAYVFVSGQIPLTDGRMTATGRVGAEISPQRARELSRQCVLAALAAADSVVPPLEGGPGGDGRGVRVLGPRVRPAGRGGGRGG